MAGEVVIVTGGGRGIGRGICEFLAGRGYAVAVWDVQKDLAMATAAALPGRQARPYQVDVADRAAVAGAVALVASELGSPYGLVNNAGILHNAFVTDLTEERWDRLIDVNLKGPFLCSQAVVPHMMERREGRIVNISSMAARQGQKQGGVHYKASKGGVLGLTNGLAVQLAEHGITVNSVAPGVIKTDMMIDRGEAYFAEMERTIPVGRVGTPADIAAAVAYFLSPEASYVTGQALHVNGGLYMA